MLWTRAQDDKLREMWGSLSCVEIAEVLGLGRDGKCKVIGRAYRLGLSTPRQGLWTAEADSKLMRLWRDGSMSIRDIAVAFGLTGDDAARDRIKSRVRRLKLGFKVCGLPLVRTKVCRATMVRSQAAPILVPAASVQIINVPDVIPAPDAKVVHPEFDPSTLTWFIPGIKHEARSLRELQVMVGTGMRFAEYRRVADKIGRPPLNGGRDHPQRAMRRALMTRLKIIPGSPG